jgi:hypothetical protein
MEDWLPERVKTVLRALLDGEAQTPRAQREEILTRAARAAGDAPGSLPPSLAAHVDRVAHHAYKITDEQIDALKAEHGEDRVFEVTLLAAFGAGLKRLRKGLSLLRAEGRHAVG